MKNENLIYLLEVIASTASNDIESDEFEVVWEDKNGMEGWTTESITATAKQAAGESQRVQDHGPNLPWLPGLRAGDG